MIKLIQEGLNEFRIPSGKEFIGKNIGRDKDPLIKLVSKFAWKMTYGSGEHRPNRSGGTKKREKNEILIDVLQGKLGELLVWIELNKIGIKVNDPNFKAEKRGFWDAGDLFLEDSNVNFSVKTFKHFSNLLLLEKKDLDSNGFYKHTIDNFKKEYIYILIRIKFVPALNQSVLENCNSFGAFICCLNEINFQYEISGFAIHADLQNVINSEQIIYKGNILNKNTKMDADNYYIHIKDLRPFIEIGKFC